MSLFRLNNGFRLPENRRGCQSLEITFGNAISCTISCMKMSTIGQTAGVVLSTAVATSTP